MRFDWCQTISFNYFTYIRGMDHKDYENKQIWYDFFLGQLKNKIVQIWFKAKKILYQCKDCGPFRAQQLISESATFFFFFCCATLVDEIL